MWHLEYDGALPPLPPMVRAARGNNVAKEILKAGCWHVSLDPTFSDDFEGLYKGGRWGWLARYEGTLRVEHSKRGLLASGDLYVINQQWNDPGMKEPPPLKGPQPRKIPIFPRRDYRFYVRLEGMRVAGLVKPKLTLEIATWRFDKSSGTWSEHGTLSAVLSRRDGSDLGWGAEEYLEGEVLNQRGTSVGRIALGWVGASLRRAIIEMDRTSGVALPTNDGAGVGLGEVFQSVGWEVELPDRPQIVPGPDDGVWGDRMLHEAMLKWRESTNLDEEWRYYIFVVPFIGPADQFRLGRMYDLGSIDSNLVPREALVVSAHAKFPQDSIYGSAAGQRHQDIPSAFFRTTIHELGHALGLLHNHSRRYFMQGVELLAKELDGKFPGGIDMCFHPEDVARLKHLPDPWVRPGGLRFGHRIRPIPIEDEDVINDVSDSFEIEVRPLQRLLPLGAPLRVHLRLVNTSDKTLPGPGSLSMEKGVVEGRIFGPGGVKYFATAKRLTPLQWRDYCRGEAIEHSMTLMRGPEGPLLPTPGRYRLLVEAIWSVPGGLARVDGETSVWVAAPRSEATITAALDVLDCPEAAIPLIFRSHPGDSAEKVWLRALLDPVLGPHFAGLEAIRLADNGPDDLTQAPGYLLESTVLNWAEVDRLLRYFETAAGSKPEILKDQEVRRAIQVLRSKGVELEAVRGEERNREAESDLSRRAENLLVCEPKPKLDGIQGT